MVTYHPLWYFFSIMIGLGETYFAAFMLAYGFSELLSGLIVSIPLIGGAILQLLTPKIVRLVGNYKRFVIGGVLLQGSCFFLIALLAFTPNLPAIVIFALATLYWGTGMAVGSAWNAWMHSLIPESLRTGFFSKRTSFNYLTILLSVLATGLMLEYGKKSTSTLTIFALMFSLSALSRILSAFYLSKQSVPTHNIPVVLLSFKSIFHKLLREEYGKILFFVLVFRFGVYFSAPYFTPYMLVQLKMSYPVYMSVVIASILGRIAIMSFTKNLTRLLGHQKLLLISAIGICFIPLQWLLLSSSFLLIFVVEFFSGVLWGCFELSLFLIILGRVPEGEQTELLSSFNLINNAVVVVGSLCGGACLSLLAHQVPVTELSGKYGLILLSSSVLRGLALLLLIVPILKTKYFTLSQIETAPLKE